jgi:hypothetical protein
MFLRTIPIRLPCYLPSSSDIIPQTTYFPCRYSDTLFAFLATGQSAPGHCVMNFLPFFLLGMWRLPFPWHRSLSIEVFRKGLPCQVYVSFRDLQLNLFQAIYLCKYYCFAYSKINAANLQLLRSCRQTTSACIGTSFWE